jgi:WD40 repeat protein
MSVTNQLYPLSSNNLIVSVSRKYLIDGVGKNKIKIFSLAGGLLVNIPPRQNAKYLSIDISRNDKYVVAIDMSGFIEIWNYSDVSRVASFQMEGYNGGMISFSPDGKGIIFTSSDSNGVGIYYLPIPELGGSNSNEVEIYKAYTADSSLLSFEFSYNGDKLYCIDKSKDRVAIYNTKNGYVLSGRFPIEKNNLSFIINPARDEFCQVYRTTTGITIERYNEMTNGMGIFSDDNGNTFSKISYSIDGKYLLISNPSIPFNSMIIETSTMIPIHMISLNGISSVVNIFPMEKGIASNDLTFSILGDGNILRLSYVPRQDYYDISLDSESLFDVSLSLERLKNIAKTIDFPGYERYNNKDILREVLITYRDMSRNVYPQKFSARR